MKWTPEISCLLDSSCINTQVMIERSCLEHARTMFLVLFDNEIVFHDLVANGVKQR